MTPLLAIYLWIRLILLPCWAWEKAKDENRRKWLWALLAFLFGFLAIGTLYFLSWRKKK